MSDFLLFYPPLVKTGLSGPPLGVQQLTFYCQSLGFSGEAIDLNIAFIREITQQEHLRVAAAAAPTGSRAKIRLESFFKAPGSERLGYARALDYTLSALLNPLGSDDSTGSTEKFLSSAAWAAAESIILAQSPRFVGMSILSFTQIPYALAIARTLRQHKQIKIVLGGPELSGWSEAELKTLIHSTSVDHIVLGDGEISFSSLLRGRECLSLIKGRSLKLSQSPIDGCFVLNPHDYVAPYSYNVLESRGCYWNRCTHCDYISLQPELDYGRPIEALVEKLEQVRLRSGIRRFHLINETLTPSRARKLASCVRETRAGFKWNCFVKIDKHFSQDIIQILPSGGCEYLVIGLESLSTRAIGILDKGYTADEAVAWLRSAREAGVKLSVNFIVGIPGTSSEDEVETLQRLQEFPELARNAKVYKFVLSRLSMMGQRPRSFGLNPIAQHSPTAHRGGSSVPLDSDVEIAERYSKFVTGLGCIVARERNASPIGRAMLARRVGFPLEKTTVRFSPTLSLGRLGDDEGGEGFVYDCRIDTSLACSVPELQIIGDMRAKQPFDVACWFGNSPFGQRDNLLRSLNEAGLLIS